MGTSKRCAGRRWKPRKDYLLVVRKPHGGYVQRWRRGRFQSEHEVSRGVCDCDAAGYHQVCSHVKAVHEEALPVPEPRRFVVDFARRVCSALGDFCSRMDFDLGDDDEIAEVRVSAVMRRGLTGLSDIELRAGGARILIRFMLQPGVRASGASLLVAPD